MTYKNQMSCLRYTNDQMAFFFTDAGGEDGEKKEKVEDVENAEAEKAS